MDGTDFLISSGNSVFRRIFLRDEFHRIHTIFTKFASFVVVLSNGQLSDMVGDYLSASQPIIIRVIQGGLQKPVLFLMYIRNKVATLFHGTPFFFVNDIEIARTLEPRPDSPRQSCARWQDVLNHLYRYSLWRAMQLYKL